MISIESEIGRLRAVMVHQPGAEIDRMVPSMAEEMLFDDIIYGRLAREEHRRLQRILSLVADEVLTLQQLLAESLESPEQRQLLFTQLEQRLDLTADTLERLAASPSTELAEQLVAGIVQPGLSRVPHSLDGLFVLPPLPNLFFMRDPAVVIGQRVALGSMGSNARLREPLLLRHVVTCHPRFRSASVLFDRFDPNFLRRSTAHPRPSIEGGDVLVPRFDLLIIGNSQRTTRHTIEELAESLRTAQSTVRTVLIVDLPKTRSYMHLDTVFTQISADECLIYEPVIAEGQVEQAAVYELDIGKRELSFKPRRSLLSALKAHGLDLEPISCGAADPIAQQREQWTDGANAFALAPGVILLYRRNVRTLEQLHRAGYQVIGEDDLLLGRVERDLTGATGKCVIVLDCHELSRARGGPRCMTMPLLRDVVSV